MAGALLALAPALAPQTQAQPAFTDVGGEIARNTAWTRALGVLRVTNHVVVRNGAVLTIGPGTQVRLAEEVSLTVLGGSGLDIQGEPGRPVTFSSLTGSNLWAGLGARGAGSWLNLRWVEMRHGQCSLQDGATGTLDRCVFQDFRRVINPALLAAPILVSQSAANLRVRGCVFRAYDEVLLRDTPSLLEDSVFEEIHGDGLDFDYAPPGCIVRDCTFRTGSGTNIDGVDIGSSSKGVLVERCRIQGFPYDKGVSIGEGSTGVVVRDCLIFDVETGISVKDSSRAELYHNTITRAGHGFRFYEKNTGQGGGSAVAWNHVLWGVRQSVALDALSSLWLSGSDVEGGYAGTNNLSVDPLFRDASHDDFRLSATSPVRGVGPGAADLGASFPLGSSLFDGDRDGLPDRWEEEHLLNPGAPGEERQDPDADGADNHMEFVSGTDPRQGSSLLRMGVAITAEHGARLSWEAAPRRFYRLDRLRPDSGAGWETVWTARTLLGTARLEWTDAEVNHAGGCWYRVEVFVD